MPENPKGPPDPALHPDWVWSEGGTLVPYQSPAATEAARIQNERIAREKAAYEQGFPVAGHDREEDGGMER